MLTEGAGRAATRNVFVLLMAGAALSACAALSQNPPPPPPAPAVATVHPEIWPKGQSGVTRDPVIEARIAALLAQMTVEEKVGQTIQADVGSVSADDVRRYHLGSILDGGNSGPHGNDRAPAADWLKAADEFYDASMAAEPGHVAIPVLWGSDSVHGNSNIIGATIFPHNIGLGAARDPELIRAIGEITAIETKVVGQDWTFAPTIAVVRDDRWGRSYEGYAEDPSIVRAYAGEMVRGIQGDPIAPDFLRGGHIIATAKHYLGDGGTDRGRDQGDNLSSEEELRDIFSAGYQSAIAAGVQTVMVSFSSWHGAKMTGNRALLNDVLVDRLGLDGFVISDWNAHGQLPGCTVGDCAAALLAGIDMYMAPDSWKALYESTLAEVKSGKIPMARLDEAVARILRVKLRAGLFEAGRPSRRPYGGKFGELGSAAHRAVARRAVRESLVLLKNGKAILPLAPKLRVLVAGDGADDMGKQTGGWTISWQGTGNSRADFPHGETVFEGIARTVRAAGGAATFSVDGSFKRRPDVAIVVVGENPYAEFMGDRENLAFEPGDPRDLRLIRALRAAKVPVVTVFLSGRPLYVTREINASDAFVAAFLPGSEGGGIADLLFRAKNGSVRNDFRGRLSYSWPRAPDQTPLNVGDKIYDPLFAFGYGLDYAHPHDLGVLPEAPGGEAVAANVDRYLEEGRAAPPWTVSLVAADGAVEASAPNGDLPAVVPGAPLAVRRADHLKQEDALVATWSGGEAASLAVGGRPVDLSRQAEGDMALRLDLRIDAAPTAPVMLRAVCGNACGGAVDITDVLRRAQGAGWTTLDVRLACFRAAGLDVSRVTIPFELTTAGTFGVSLTAVRLVPGEGPPACPVPPPS